MSNPNKPGVGRLAVFSSCFKGRSAREQHALPNSRTISAVPATNDQLAPSSTLPNYDQTPLPKAQLDLWQESYDATDANTQKWIYENIGEWSASTNPFPELVDLVRNREEKHDQDAWQFERRGRAVLLRDYTSRVTSCLTTIGDIAINFAPAPSPVIWNALKVVLKTNVSQVEDLVSIMGCTDLVLCLVRRGTVYQEVYLGAHFYSPIQNDLKEKLVGVYKACLEFLAFVHEELRQGNARRFLSALLSPGQGEQQVSDMKDLEQELENTARACEAVANQHKSKEHLELLKSLQLPLKRIDDGVSTVLEKLEEAERIQIMDFLSTIPVGSHHNEKCDSRTEGTCEWLVSHSRFREWEESSCSSIFWLQGSMGTGKSYLSSKVIDRYLVREGDQEFTSQHDEGFGFFYCYRSDPSRQNTESIIRSYIRQLSEVPRRPNHIHQASIELKKSSEKIQNGLPLAKCKDTLVKIIDSYPRVTLVLDALDECSNETKRELSQLFKSLVEESKGLVKVFIASRKEPDIERYLESPQSRQMLVSISTSDNAGDIEMFITHEIQEFAIEWSSIAEDTKLLVKNTLVQRSDGMFRWAYLQWQHLNNCRMNKEVRRRLERLPKTLSAAYDEIYERFEPNDFQRLMLQRVIRWVLCARRPFDSITLLQAIEAESRYMDGDNAVDNSDLNQLTLETICKDLVVLLPGSRTWGFPHASVAEHFLLKHDPWIQNAKADITILLTYLLIESCAIVLPVSLESPPPEAVEEWEESPSLQSSDDGRFKSETESLDDSVDQYALYTYNHQEWLNHIHDISIQDPKLADLIEALKLFLGQGGPKEPSTEYRVFCDRVLPCHSELFMMEQYFAEPSDNARFGITAMGLIRLLPGWWDQDLDPSELNAHGQNLLAIAAYFGDVFACKELIERGFHINRNVQRWNQSPLGRALDGRHVDVVRLLLENGANPDLLTEGQTLLCLAAHRGLEFLQPMLDAGANPNIRCGTDCTFGCALSMAALEGDVESVEALIEAGAEVNPKFANPTIRTPLASAIEGGVAWAGASSNTEWFRCARLLLEHGADANSQLKSLKSFANYDSMLEAAVAKDALNFARLLIENGADVEVPMNRQGYNTILEYAIEKGDVDFAEFLISHGADAHSPMKIGKYGSMLSAAALAPESSLDMVKFLIEKVDVDLEQLEWKVPTSFEAIESGANSPKPSTPSSMSSSVAYWIGNLVVEQAAGAPVAGYTTDAIFSERYKRVKSRKMSLAEREKYLLEVIKVHPQVLADMKYEVEEQEMIREEQSHRGEREKYLVDKHSFDPELAIELRSRQRGIPRSRMEK